MGYCEMEQILVFVIECVVLGVGIGLLLKNIAANEKFGKILNCVNGKEKLISIAIPVLAIIMAMGYLYYGHDWGGDFSEYIAQAMALVDGTVDVEVAHMQFVLENSIPGMCPAVYPWGLPLILAVLSSWFVAFWNLKLKSSFLAATNSSFNSAADFVFKSSTYLLIFTVITAF